MVSHQPTATDPTAKKAMMQKKRGAFFGVGRPRHLLNRRLFASRRMAKPGDLTAAPATGATNP